MVNVSKISDHEAPAAVVDALQTTLADTYVLYAKTHSFHWNVEGMQFYMLHNLFEEHYRNMWEALDEIAERIRALGVYAPANTTELAKGAALKEETSIPSAKDMIHILAKDHEKIASTLAECVETAQEAGDEVTADMFLQRQSWHEEAHWMLKSLTK